MYSSASFDFYLYFLNLLKFVMCSSILILSSVTIFRSLPSTLQQVDCLSPLCFFFFPVVLSCFIIWNIFPSLLILPSSLCIFLCASVTFPNLGKVILCRKHPKRLSSTLSLVTRNICSSDALIQAECTLLLL